jgi:hypothetical protein
VVSSAYFTCLPPHPEDTPPAAAASTQAPPSVDCSSAPPVLDEAEMDESDGESMDDSHNATKPATNPEAQTRASSTTAPLASVAPTGTPKSVVASAADCAVPARFAAFVAIAAAVPAIQALRY